MTKKLFLLDAMALIYRAYYAMIRSPRITTTGINTSAIFGFANVLLEVIKTENPSHLAVAFDSSGPTIRHAEFEEYKANRDATPEDIHQSVPYIMEILKALNIPILIKQGYEADDIIGTVAKQAEIEGFDVFMMTPDKDYGQLVSKHIYMYKPAKFGQKAEVLGVKEICEKYEIKEPEQLIDILGLWGDASDNIPGVPSIGEVGAKKLIKEFGSIENIYANIEQISKPKLKQNLINHEDKAILSKSLATIILDVPLEYSINNMKRQSYNEEELKKIFHQLEFKTLLPRFINSFNNPGIVVATPQIIDLFTPLDEQIENTMEQEETLLKNYSSIEHHYSEVFKWEEISGKFTKTETIYFDWIIDSKEQFLGFTFCNSSKHIYYHWVENEKKNYRHILQNIFIASRKIVTYQAKSLFTFIEMMNINDTLQIIDLQIAHYLIQPETTHQLERLTENYIEYQLLESAKVWKQERALEESVERAEVYAQLHPIFEEIITNDQLSTLFYEVEMPLCKVLAKMENTGIKLDPAILQEASLSLGEEIKTIETQIFELAETTFNLASPKQLGEVLFEKMQIITNAKLTKTKQYQTGEEVLKKLVNKHPIVNLILEWRTLSKLKSTYIDPLPQLINPNTGRIHSTFQQTVTSTGRLSSTNPNLQNIPIRTERGREIRKAFVAKDNDHLILSADYSQIELRIVASMANDKNMIAAFNKGEDIHAATAANIYKVDIDNVNATQRRYAKTVNFGILYGMGAFSLAERLQIKNNEAKELIVQYNDNFPYIEQYMNSNIIQARTHGYVETLLGRRRYIRDINSSNGMLRKGAERNAINAPIQGTAADIIKLAMINIDKALMENNLQSKMILQVHDELLFEVPKQELETLQKLLRDVMNSALKLQVPLAVEMDAGVSWFEAH